ncbi:ABC transporter ATP-binding protein [Flavobacterium aciduliphilum]|uniref:ATP-binding cassette subfamily B protein n=1 Tax=Flavobacterium aciduliphilum TaxID=1101402 RepID=A0A328Y9V3_9FLAO|nr:ABC transporter ATP-binding protein [Flavobacterium aciduliphilum]RAR70788.1 ATP-binding cassette subfamily B protein [Flavobacterium aciduliphilum]
MKELHYLNKYFIKYKYRFLLGIFITIVAQIFALFTPKLISSSLNGIERASRNNSALDSVKNELITNILLVIGATILAGFFTFLMRQTLIVMSRLVEFDLKNEIFRHYEVLDQHFYKQNRTGDLMNRISEDVAKVRMYVGPAVMYTINTIIRFLIVLIYMYNVSPKLTLYTVLPLPFLSFLIFKLSVEINKKSTLFQQFLSKVSSFNQEVFSGIRVIKAYALEKQNEATLQTLAEESKTKSIALAQVQSLFGPLMATLIGISNLIVIYMGGIMYIEGSIQNIGTIAEFILYVNMLTWPVASIGWVSSLVQEAEASQKRINEFLKTEPLVKNLSEDQPKLEGTISFQKVSFRYKDTNILALDEVSFELEKGKTLAIVGKTGSGKTTLLSLLTRMYDVDKGTITIDGIPIQEINLYHLRNSMGIVPQDTFLFSDTIENNIRFGNETATREAIEQSAKDAEIHDAIVSFTNQYQTLLGERGITLSGGQKQRVSMARALLKNPTILLLDDCLSAVDTETEDKILHRLQPISQNKTTLIVSHRVSSVKNADLIIVLENGKITQQGTHNQLIIKEGYYKNLYLKQLSEKEL